MKILIVGGGGREHTLAWKLNQSTLCSQLYCAPGNAGIDEIARLFACKAEDTEGVVTFAKNQLIDLVVVGPEAPLAEGLVDECQKHGILAFGPTQSAARIESSKIFARNLMHKYEIPTPDFQGFDSPDPAKDYVRQLHSQNKQVVIKADGLAAGKGAILTSTQEEANDAIDLCLKEKKFGTAGDTVVVEERLQGPELSILAITDGQKLIILPPSQDHKPIGESDTGPNTGGMGAYSPVPMVTDELLEKIRHTILEPAVRGMEKEGAPYTGVLYAGLMICDSQPYVIEFNCRFGDPETQAVLPVIEDDLLPILLDAAKKELKEDRVIKAAGSALCVVMASEGYPSSYEKGKEIYGFDDVKTQMQNRAVVFHAGTANKDNKIVTSGGRVLGVTGLGENFDEASSNAYSAVEKIQFDGAYYRRDIGYRVRS